MELPDAEKVAVGSRDHLLNSSLKERVSRRNLVTQNARPGDDILTPFLNFQHHKVACATQTFLSSNTQLCSCHKCFPHYRQPPSLHQSVLMFEQFAAANAKALIFLHFVHPTYGFVHPTYGLPQLRRSTVAIDTLYTVLMRSCGGQ